MDGTSETSDGKPTNEVDVHIDKRVEVAGRATAQALKSNVAASGACPGEHKQGFLVSVTAFVTWREGTLLNYSGPNQSPPVLQCPQ